MEINCFQTKTEFKPELVRDVARLGCQDPNKTRINDDAARLLAEITRLLTTEAALRSCKHASLLGGSEVDVQHVEKSILQLEVILLGSHAGVLRVFRPNGPREGNNVNALPTDLMLETQLGQPALQLLEGPFVSGSTQHQLAILGPRSVSVHVLQIALGDSELAHACSIQNAFERTLPENLGCAWQLIVGRFGAGSAAASTMSLGVVTSSGALAVYERETRQPLLLQLFSPEDLPLPGPVVYCAAKDAFLVVTPSWQLHSQKYTALAQSGREGRAPDWSVSLGDLVLELDIVPTASINGGREPSLAGPELLVLGQRSLTCWQWAGTIRFARRLPAPARCMTHHIAEGNLMVLVATETLLLYCDGQLRWSSQPPFPPIIMGYISLESVPGHLVLVSDNLEIQCCVLGTEPTLFCAPPSPSTASETTETMREELTRITADIKQLTTNAAVSQPELTAQMMLKVGENVFRGILRLGVVAPLSLVSVVITTASPVSAVPDTISISSLCNSVEIPITFAVASGPAPANLNVHVAVSYAQADGTPHVTQADVVKLPLALVLAPVTRLGVQLPLHSKLSFDFLGDSAKVIKLHMIGSRSQTPGGVMILQDGTEEMVSLNFTSSDSTGGTCHVSSSSNALISLVACSVLSCLQCYVRSAPEAVTWLSIAADRHYTSCCAFRDIENEVEKGAIWVRQVQLRLLARYKDRSARTLNNLDSLLYESMNDLNAITNRLLEADKTVEQTSRELSAVLNLCCCLLAVTDPAPSTEKLMELRAALAVDNVDKQWVESVTAALELGLPGASSGASSTLSDAQPARIKALLARKFARLLQEPHSS